MTPAEWITDGEWPTGTISRSAPPHIAVIAHIALRLQQLYPTAADQSAAASRAGIEPGELAALIAGTVVPDFETVVALDRTAGTRLWPATGRPRIGGRPDRCARRVSRAPQMAHRMFHASREIIELHG